VNSNFAQICNDFRSELLRQWREYYDNDDDDATLTGAVDELLRIQLDVMERTVSDFVTENAARIRDKLKGVTAQWAKEAIEIADNFENMAMTTRIDTRLIDGL